MLNLATHVLVYAMLIGFRLRLIRGPALRLRGESLFYDLYVVMNIVNVAILKEKLSYYLGLVKSSDEVLVTSHRHRIARISDRSWGRYRRAHPAGQRLA